MKISNPLPPPPQKDTGPAKGLHTQKQSPSSYPQERLHFSDGAGPQHDGSYGGTAISDANTF